MLGRHRISNPRERRQEGFPWLSTATISFGERVTEEPLVLSEDLRVPVVAEVLKVRGGPFDVGEDEGDRPPLAGSSRTASSASVGPQANQTTRSAVTVFPPRTQNFPCFDGNRVPCDYHDKEMKRVLSDLCSTSC